MYNLKDLINSFKKALNENANMNELSPETKDSFRSKNFLTNMDSTNSIKRAKASSQYSTGQKHIDPVTKKKLDYVAKMINPEYTVAVERGIPLGVGGKPEILIGFTKIKDTFHESDIVYKISADGEVERIDMIGAGKLPIIKIPDTAVRALDKTIPMIVRTELKSTVKPKTGTDQEQA